MEGKIYLEPVNKVINKINSTAKDSIILLGYPGTGKSLILDEYQKNSNFKNIIINGSLQNFEYIFIPDKEIFNLYQICLIIEKMILYVNKNYSEKIYKNFMFIENTICNILKNINCMIIIKNYGYKQLIDKRYLKNPEILLENFIYVAMKSIDYKTLTLIIDNFDSIGESSISYQKYLYNTLSKYLKVIFAISDSKVINDKNKIEELSIKNDIIEVNYSFDIETIKIILNNPSYFKELKYLLSNETILEMIKYSQGNIYKMNLMIKEMYNNILNNNLKECDIFIKNYINNQINNINTFGYKNQNRKLHI